MVGRSAFQSNRLVGAINSVDCSSFLQPDVTAPGLNILAAWSESSAPTKLDGDERRVKYNLMSGTSMSCPHVAATAALLRTIHRKWSSAAIRSAIITTGPLFSILLLLPILS